MNNLIWFGGGFIVMLIAFFFDRSEKKRKYYKIRQSINAYEKAEREADEIRHSMTRDEKDEYCNGRFWIY